MNRSKSDIFLNVLLFISSFFVPRFVLRITLNT